MSTSKRALLLTLVAIVAVAAYAEKPVRKPQESFAPYWTSEPGWDTELQLKNNLSSGPLTVTPVLRVASGEEIPLDPVTIPSNVSVSVWVNEGLLKHSPSLLSQPGSYGSVVFRFTSLSAMNLYATAIPSIQGEPIVFPVLAHPIWQLAGALGANGPGSLEGIWWQPRAGLNDLLVISNSSEKRISGTLSLFDASGKRWSEALVLSPHQTLRMSTSDLLQKAALSGSYGGIKVDLPASAGAVDGVHFMYDEASKFSAFLEMFSRDPNATLRERAGIDARQWTMRAPMLALRVPDPAAGLPVGIVVQPMILVHNTTAKNISADISLSWRSDSVKGQAKLPTMQLAPFATQQLQIGAMQKQLGIPDTAHWAMASLTTNASPDDLIALASSRDASGRYGFETRFMGGSGGYFTGGEWRYDSNHNQIISVTNSGIKPTDALLTLHYDNGEKKYEMQQTIQPGDQMWVNLSQLVRQRIPDRTGNTLPVDVSSVTYDLRDLAQGSHSLTVGELAVGGAWGFQAVQPPCPECCGKDVLGFSPDPIDLATGDTDTVAIDGVLACNGNPAVLTPDFTVWGSDNTGVAKVSYAKVQGVATGSTTGYANGLLQVPGACGCNFVPAETYVQIAVISFKATGKAYIFVGTDPNELYGNHYTLTDSTGTQNPQPPGGTCCAASSDASDEVTQPGTNPPIFQFETLDQSATVGDRTLTFEYDLSGGGGESQQISVTARKFAYLTNDSPPNTCTLPYGTNRTYTYTVYTHPDHGAVLGSDGLSNTAVSESFSPALTCETITGNKYLNQNGQFMDNITSLCSSQPLTCAQTASQTLSVAGYSVRTNTLQWTRNGVTYTSQGPSQ